MFLFSKSYTNTSSTMELGKCVHYNGGSLLTTVLFHFIVTKFGLSRLTNLLKIKGSAFTEYPLELQRVFCWKSGGVFNF